MKKFMLIVASLAVLCAPAAAQTGRPAPPTPEQAKAKVEESVAIKQKNDEAQANLMRSRTLTNVLIELTLTDQSGTAPAEKKTVSMIVASGSLGKSRTAGTIRPQADAPYPVMLNVDARPFLNADGSVNLELAVEYYPLKEAGQEKEGAKQRPSGVNQSQTIVLQSGKPLVISQAADPIADRKVILEVKATVLK